MVLSEGSKVTNAVFTQKMLNLHKHTNKPLLSCKEITTRITPRQRKDRVLQYNNLYIRAQKHQQHFKPKPPDMKKELLILLSIFALSCNHDENNVTDKTAANLVTGVNFRQNFDDASFQLGNPNVLVNNKFIIYPNPASETVFVSAQENVTDVWIVPANPERIYQDVDFSSILNTSLYTEQSIVTNSDFSLTDQSSNNITLNIGTLAKGYYKVFVKIGGELYWDNLYKYEDPIYHEEEMSEIINFWY
jgi:hypothetical protein